MDKNQQKQILDRKLTWVGSFVHWADGVQVNGKILKLSFMIWAAAFVIGQQESNWDFFRGEKVVRAEGELPQLAPKKEIKKDSSLQCETETAGINAVGELSLDQFAIKKNIEKIIDNKPMQTMIEAVAQRDALTATYLVAIAKKESNLGKFSPKNSAGKECYNYWGYRGPQKTTESGYSCFDSPEQAVAAVGDRIQYLSQVNKFDTPEKMSVWKCGFNCSWDNPVAVKKWIADVDLYYKKINPTPIL